MENGLSSFEIMCATCLCATFSAGAAFALAVTAFASDHPGFFLFFGAMGIMALTLSVVSGKIAAVEDGNRGAVR